MAAATGTRGVRGTEKNPSSLRYEYEARNRTAAAGQEGQHPFDSALENADPHRRCAGNGDLHPLP